MVKSAILKSGCLLRSPQVIVGKGEKGGILVVNEFEKLFPEVFSTGERIKRDYYIYNNTLELSVRGGHYHPLGKFELMTCKLGSVEVCLRYRDKTGNLLEERLFLSGAFPSVLLIVPLVWHSVSIGRSEEHTSELQSQFHLV